MVRREVRRRRRAGEVDFVVANAENASGGRGLDPEALDELLDGGVDVVTSGNHIWQHRSLLPSLDRDRNEPG